ncbi:NAD(P)H-binding protein [Streptomyces sp. RKAG293]|uniref:NmrA family NAD(P)-binding protein n=1 Tax=Streptomyces sp. RKAG293 TaxID=2893403 RepID=UPI0025537D8F|nr:NAD(P)H-binding protein [Streptomyces sp. RKAG293]
MILVTGASGNVGGELVGVLAAAGRPVRALIRDTERFEARPGVEVVTGDLNRAETLTGALDGVEGVFLLGGFADMLGVLDRIRSAGAGHVVLLSSRSVAGGDPANAIVAMHQDSEAAVRGSGVGWTILRSSGFMSNTFEWVPQLRDGDEVHAPFAEVGIAVIDPYDIASVAAAVLNDPDYHGRHLHISGPEALRPADRLATLARVLGRPLTFRAQPDAEARAEMSRTVPERYVDAFFRFFSDGDFDDAPVLPTVEVVTGRPARTFEDWATAHAGAFS